MDGRISVIIDLTELWGKDINAQNLGTIFLVYVIQ
jgi:hypothetical protein